MVELVKEMWPEYMKHLELNGKSENGTETGASFFKQESLPYITALKLL